MPGGADLEENLALPLEQDLAIVQAARQVHDPKGLEEQIAPLARQVTRSQTQAPWLLSTKVALVTTRVAVLRTVKRGLSRSGGSDKRSRGCHKLSLSPERIRQTNDP